MTVMGPPPEFLLPLQIVSAYILAGLMGTATIVWFIRMRNVGGIAGNYFTFFFACIMMFAISIVLMVSANSAEIATFWGVLAILHGITGMFTLFLSGEYSITDRPPPLRVMTVGTCYGISMGGFIYTLFQPPGNGLILMTYVPGFGWIIHVVPVFILMNLLSVILSLGFFLHFCHKAFWAAPHNSFGKRTRTLLVALSLGLCIDCLVIGIGWIIEDFAIFSPIIITISTSVFQILAFFLLFREYRIIFFIPHKAFGIIVLNTEGIVYFNHDFQREGGLNAIRDYLGSALNTVSSLVQETLDLPAIEWIREFQTKKLTFLLDVRPQEDIVGLLLVSQPTQILRKAFVRFMNNLITLCLKSKGDFCDTPEKEQHVHEICADAFPFIPPID